MGQQRNDLDRRRMRPLPIGIALGVASIWLPREAIDPMARALTPAIALLATGIFPCMSLAVGAMKGENRAPRQVDELYEQLHTVMRVLVAAFALAVTAIVLIVAILGFLAVQMEEKAGNVAVHVTLSIVALVLALLFGRAIAIGKAFFAILEINRKGAKLVTRSKLQGQRDAALEALKQESFEPDLKAAKELERL